MRCYAAAITRTRHNMFGSITTEHSWARGPVDYSAVPAMLSCTTSHRRTPSARRNLVLRWLHGAIIRAVALDIVAPEHHLTVTPEVTLASHHAPAPRDK